ncbi:helix-turn-helix domain-containing protein [Suttonella sp. R2A3]|uniref:helix-turn-helix domain-containing protein n=1 Tax=Suttonella sp. R2A3 TaxID=2908648 RepID=UPI001F2D8C2F|nr:helix-turn-helix domain-containing protein [Suttonella sp. R2A3]UJF24771.1 helix-turn-helix domain-containing protein [Suttonella sp. R2A3]
MKKAATPIQDSRPTASGYILPKKLQSVIAELLARLLEGQTLSQHDATKILSTTRLSAYIYELRHTYGWDIETLDETAPCADGRTASYGRYRLIPSELYKLSTEEREKWIEAVYQARLILREGGAA